ncbi:HD domain-containing protein [Candidatus Pyrohabitans sp.]
MGELNLAVPNKIFRDPVHNYIEITEIERCMIDTPWMQRLRNIIHMATAQKTYMSAHCSRFEHSIGVLYVTGKIIEVLDKKWILDEIIEKCAKNMDIKNKMPFFNFDSSERDLLYQKKCELKQMVRLVALLHDIGHGPFSHTSEEFLRYGKKYNKFNEAKGGDYDLRPHEIVSLEMMLDYLPKGIEKIIKLHDLTEKELYSFNFVKNFLSQKELLLSLFVPEYATQFDDEGALRPLNMIINSQLDADKLDYLLRDSYTTGAEFGKIIDLGRLVMNYDIDSEGYLCLDKKALSAAESLVVARYKIYKYLYHHHVVCLTDEILRRAILHGINGGLFDSTYPFSSERFGNIEVDEEEGMIKYDSVDDFYVYQKIREAEANNDEISKAKFYLKMYEERKLPKALWKISDPPSLVDKNFFENGNAFNRWKNLWIQVMIEIKRLWQTGEKKEFIKKFEDLQEEIWKISSLGRLGYKIDSEDTEKVDEVILKKLNENYSMRLDYKDIITAQKSFSPYSSPFQFEKSKRINIIIEADGRRKSVDLEELSPLIESLSLTWSLYQGSYGVYVYVSKNIKEMYKNKIAKAIKQAIRD